jgi:glycosyltransferase involved in cell wall biosynthesis
MSKPLKILIGADVPPDPNAGASGTVWQMAEALKRRGHLVDNIWADDLGRKINHGNLHYWLELPRTYRREVNKKLTLNQYDIIELNQPHAYLVAQDHRKHKRKGVFLNRSHGHEVRSEECLDHWRKELSIKTKTGLSRILSQFLKHRLDNQWVDIAKNADGFIVSCSDDRDFLISRYNIAQQNIGMITQGVPDSHLNQPAELMNPTRLKKLIYVGQKAFFKAPHLVSAIANSILAQHPDTTLTWVCSQNSHQEVASYFSTTLLQRVNLQPWVSQSALVNILDEHGIFLFPSYFEGFGKAPLEAMARGLCVVASDVGGMRDFIQSGCNGHLVKSGDLAGFVNNIQQLFSNPESASLISLHARKTAEQHTWDRCAADIENFYQQMLAQKSGTAKL